MINSGRIRLLDHQRLIGQLCSLERRTSRGGRDSIDHPPDAHDDVANSVCGPLVGLSAAARDADYASLKWVTGDTGRERDRITFTRPLWQHPYLGWR
jgi:hypothetical protein